MSVFVPLFKAGNGRLEGVDTEGGNADTVIGKSGRCTLVSYFW